MGGIVIELQREALDEKNSIESLIRKAYLVAKNSIGNNRSQAQKR